MDNREFLERIVDAEAFGVDTGIMSATGFESVVEAVKAAMQEPTWDLTTLKARLALAPEPRKVALGLDQNDVVSFFEVTTNGVIADEVGIEFRAFVHNYGVTVFGITVYMDGTYSSFTSACVSPTHPDEFLEAYVRAHKFIKAYGLKHRS